MNAKSLAVFLIIAILAAQAAAIQSAAAAAATPGAVAEAGATSAKSDPWSWLPDWWPWKPKPAAATNLTLPEGAWTLASANGWGTVTLVIAEKGKALEYRYNEAGDVVLPEPIPGECLEMEIYQTASQWSAPMSWVLFRAKDGTVFSVTLSVTEYPSFSQRVDKPMPLGNYSGYNGYTCSSNEAWELVKNRKPGDLLHFTVTIKSFEPALNALGYSAADVEAVGLLAFTGNTTVRSVPRTSVSAKLDIKAYSWLKPYLASLTVDGVKYNASAGAILLPHGTAIDRNSRIEATVMAPIAFFHVPVKFDNFR